MAIKKLAVKKEVEAVKKPEPVETAHDKPKQDLINLLKSTGAEPDESKSYDELLASLQKQMSSLQDDAVKKEVDGLQVVVNRMKAKTNITDDSFLLRLASIGVLPIYLHPYTPAGANFETYLFSDLDTRLTDAQVWHKIRHSGITTIAKEDKFKQRFKKA